MSKDSENESERLGREWMASEHWGGWRKGMISDYGWLCMQDGEPPASGQEFIPTGYPDLDHPGTRAFLIEDVRRAWMDAGSVLDVRYGPASFLFVAIGADNDRPEFRGHTEAGTLIAALRAAPEKTK